MAQRIGRDIVSVSVSPMRKKEKDATDFISRAIDAEEKSEAVRLKVKKKAQNLARKETWKYYFRTFKYHHEEVIVLHHAVQYALSFLTRLLVEELNVEADTKDCAGRGVLHHALQSCSDNSILLTYLVKKCDVKVDDKDDSGTTPFQSAIILGKTWGVKTLLELQADTKQEFFYGKAVHAACAMDDAEALKTLIESGANVDEEYFLYLNPLAVATFFGSMSCAEVLMQKEANVKLKSLIYKGIIGKATHEMIKSLLDNGADANDFDGLNHEEFPIFAAAKRGQWDVVELLLPHTAPIAGVKISGDKEGIAGYIQSEEYQTQDAAARVTRVTALRNRLFTAVRCKKYLVAEIACMLLKHDIDDDEWDHVYHLCQFCFWHAGNVGGVLNASSLGLYNLGRRYIKLENYAVAVMALKGSLAFDTSNVEVHAMLGEAAKKYMGVGMSGTSATS